MKKIEKVVPYVFLIVMFGVIIFSFRDNPISKVLSGHDSSMFLYFGRGISDGLVPYKDMLDHKGPILFIIEYLAVLIGLGNISLGIWIVECLFLFFSLIFLYKTNYLYTENRLVSTLALVLMTPLFILCYDGGNYSEEFALLFISIAFYVFSKILFQKKVSQISYIVVGLVGAATFFIRVNMIALWVVFCLFLFFTNIKDKKMDVLIKQIKGIFIGGIAFTMLIILLSLFQGNLKEMFQQAFVMNLLYSDSNLTDKIRTTFNFIDLLLRTGLFPLIVVFFISIFLDRKRIETKVYSILSFYFFFNFLTVVLSGRYYTHYLITQLAPLSIVIAISIQYILSPIVKKEKQFIAFLILLAISFPATISAFKTYNWNFSVYPNSDTNQIEVLSKYIKKNTNKKDTIYVHNINANVYLLSGRYSNSRFFVLPSVNYDDFPKMQSEFSKKMSDNPPKYIVIRRQALADRQSSSNLNNVVFDMLESNFHEISKINVDNYILYEMNR